MKSSDLHHHCPGTSDHNWQYLRYLYEQLAEESYFGTNLQVIKAKTSIKIYLIYHPVIEADRRRAFDTAQAEIWRLWQVGAPKSLVKGRFTRTLQRREEVTT
jgi:hypothetical protein